MSQALLLDTHIMLWLDAGDDRLKPHTRTLIEDHWRSGGDILVSAVSAWEIAVLVDAGRIVLDLRPDAWVARFMARPGFVAAPLSMSAAARAYELVGFPHRDPADRLLVACAIETAARFVTYDQRILDYANVSGADVGLIVAV